MLLPQLPKYLSMAFWVLLFLARSIAFAQAKIDTLQLLHDVKVLSADSMQGRKTCTIGSKRAQEYVISAFKKHNLQAFEGSFRQFFSASAKDEPCTDAANLIGYLPGTSTDCIVLSAHYDHLGVVGGKTYPGADDNASGVATLLAIVAYFTSNKPHSTLIFAFFDAEESGLQGARVFVNKLPVEKKRVILNVNLDMVSRSDRNELYVAGCHHYPFLKPYLEKIATISKVKLLFGHDSGTNPADNWTNASDHAPFHRAGIPFAYFGVEDHRDYHRPSDTFANVDQKFFVNAASTILDAIIEFDRHLAEIKLRTPAHTPSGN
ncbi:M28 family peptidase [candidate division KSB1 bacterium]|nr:M28 family peptidase [candidate division KSB1 bacterium]